MLARVTAVASVKLEPVMVTCEPTLPSLGATSVMRVSATQSRLRPAPPPPLRAR